MYQSLDLPWPTSPIKEPLPLLIYGGSTATGTLAVQFAKLSGLTVIATSRAHNFELLKSLGADAVFDYTDPQVGEKIRAHTSNKLHYAFDCVSEGASFAICAAALSSDSKLENVYSALFPPGAQFPRADVSVRSTMAYTALGEPINGPQGPFDPPPDHHEHAKRMFALTQQLLEQRKLKTHPAELRSGGLDAVLEGCGLTSGRSRMAADTEQAGGLEGWQGQWEEAGLPSIVKLSARATLMA